MMQNNFKKTIDDLKKAILENAKCALFLGAGISISAGIPGAKGIVIDVGRRLLKDKNATNNDVYSWLTSQAFFDPNCAYASILDAAFANEAERLTYFECLIRGKHPTIAHRCIANMISNVLVQAVVTTNFDRLMEHAVLEICNNFPCVYQSDQDPYDFTPQSRRAKILKLHGDYLYGNIRNLDHELSLVKHNMSSKLAFAAKVGVLIVAGYSGGDTTIMNELKQLVQDSSTFNKGIFWLTLRNNIVNEETLKIIHLSADRGSGIIDITNTDDFFSLLLTDYPEIKRKYLVDIDIKKLDFPITNPDAFVTQQLDSKSSTEFLSLLNRRDDLMLFTKSVVGIDYLLARFEELGYLPWNLAELIDRYIDYLVAWKNISYDCPGITKYEQRKQELMKLGFITLSVDGNQTELKIIKHYLDSILYLENGLDLDKIEEMIKNNESYESLCIYVGLINDATVIIQDAITHSTNTPLLYGRKKPWPEMFYRACALVGFSKEIDDKVVDRIVDLLLLEFDGATRWPIDAIRTLTKMGHKIIDQILGYLLDEFQDSDSREFAAKVLGNIGTRVVINRISEVAEGSSSASLKYLIYALGETENYNAISVIRKLAKNLEKSNQFVINEALAKLDCNEGIEAENFLDNTHLKQDINAAKLLEKYLPEALKDTASLMLLYQYSKNPDLTLAFLNEKLKNFDIPPILKSLIQIGRTLRNQGDLAEAGKVFEWCIDNYPMFSFLYHDLALIYSRQKRYLCARRYYTIGWTLKPWYSDFYNDFAFTLIQLREYQAARFMLNNAISIDFDNYRPWLNLASLNYSQETAPMKLFEKGIEMAGGGLLRSWEAETSFDPTRLKDAQVCLRRVLSLRPDHPTATSTLREINTILEANEEFEPNINELISVLHIHDITPPDKIPLENFPEDVLIATEESAKYRNLGKYELAAEELLKAYKICPNSIGIMHNLSLTFDLLGKKEEAIKIIERALNISPWNHNLLLNYSDFLRQAQRYNEAVQAAQNVIRIKPLDPIGWIALAESYFDKEESSKATDAIRQAIRLSLPWSPAYSKAVDNCKKWGLKDLIKY